MVKHARVKCYTEEYSKYSKQGSECASVIDCKVFQTLTQLKCQKQPPEMQEVLCQKRFLKNFADFTGKHLR